MSFHVVLHWQKCVSSLRRAELEKDPGATVYSLRGHPKLHSLILYDETWEKGLLTDAQLQAGSPAPHSCFRQKWQP